MKETTKNKIIDTIKAHTKKPKDEEKMQALQALSLFEDSKEASVGDLVSMVIDGDKREALTKAAKDQKSASQAAIDIVITADYEKMTRQYGEKGTRFAQLEAGHAAQNICLQVTALKLGTVTMGYFDDDAVKKVLGISDGAEPLYIMPVGRTGA